MLDGLVPPLLVVATGLVSAVLLRSAGGTSARRRAIAQGAIAVGVVILTMGLEFAMGRAPTYRHGPVRLWSGDINSDQNSQQVFDPYSFTHVIHGAAFYGLTRLVPGTALALAPTTAIVVTLEAAWEAYENTDEVINRYRQETVSLGYYGDSLLNSLADIGCCVGGLLLAWRKPAWITVTWVAGVELALAFFIRDNLTLNLIMLIHPVAAIRVWQLGA